MHLFLLTNTQISPELERYSEEELNLAKEIQNDIIGQTGQVLQTSFDWVGDEPFRLFVLLAVAVTCFIFLLFRNESAGFKMAAALLLFFGAGTIGVFSLPDRSPPIVEKSKDDPSPIIPELAVNQSANNQDQEKYDIEKFTSPLKIEFNNRTGFLEQRPQKYNSEKSWFAYVGAFGEKEKAIKHAKNISMDFLNVIPIVFLDGARVSWVVALATWTTKEKAREAADFAISADIENTSYIEKFPKNIFDKNPDLYYFKGLK